MILMLNTSDIIGTVDCTREQIEFRKSSPRLFLGIMSSGDIY